MMGARHRTWIAHHERAKHPLPLISEQRGSVHLRGCILWELHQSLKPECVCNQARAEKMLRKETKLCFVWCLRTGHLTEGQACRFLRGLDIVLVTGRMYMRICALSIVYCGY
jgi:hypothetical protein